MNFDELITVADNLKAAQCRYDLHNSHSSMIMVAFNFFTLFLETTRNVSIGLIVKGDVLAW